MKLLHLLGFASGGGCAWLAACSSGGGLDVPWMGLGLGSGVWAWLSFQARLGPFFELYFLFGHLGLSLFVLICTDLGIL